MTSAAPFRSVSISFEGSNKETREEPIKLYKKSLRSAKTTCKMKFEGEEDHENDKENGSGDEMYSDYEDFEYSEHLRFSCSTANRRSSLRESSSNNRGSRESASSHQDKRESASSHRDKRDSKASSRDKRDSKADSRQMRNASVSSSKAKDPDNVIAVFGAYGVTGHYFLKLALEAGYQVRALMLPGIVLDEMQGNDNLSLITGTLDDENKIRRVVKNSSFVVCMLTDCENTLQAPPSAKSPPPTTTFDFIKRLCPILENVGLCKVFLYQASCYALDAKGAAPIFSQLCKKVALRKTRRAFFQEQDQIVQYLLTQIDQDQTSFIITRPGAVIVDKPSKKKLAASKSQPGPFPITNIDLAEFSLNALKTTRLYNTCPYVVQDGI